MIGAMFAGGWHAIARGGVANHGFTYNLEGEPHQVFSWIISLISMPMGILFGALAGVLCVAVGGYRR